MESKNIIYIIILNIGILLALGIYDYFFTNGETINLIISLNSIAFANISLASLIIILSLFFIARSLETFLHEMGHWLSIFGRGKLNMNLIKLLIPFWPGGSLAQVESDSETPIFWRPVLDIAGIAVNVAIAFSIFLFFNNYNFNNYLHIFIFFFGFSSLKSAYTNIISPKETSDFTKFCEIFKIPILFKSIIGFIICLIGLIFFKEYYIDNLFILINSMFQNNIIFSLNLPF